MLGRDLELFRFFVELLVFCTRNRGGGVFQINLNKKIELHTMYDEPLDHEF